MPQMLRADAEDNKERLLDAARRLFADRGLIVTMRDVARAADVGPATLYRRFPTKQDLIDEAFADELHACRAIVSEGCADPDPWRGLCDVLRRVGELNARNQGFTDAVLSSRPESLGSHRADMLRELADLCGRAQRAGRLRAGVGIDDLVLVLMAGRGLSGAMADIRMARARRFASLAIEAFRA
ncbi:TetR/AcrR family transcriptional regulator [soil metagenome]